MVSNIGTCLISWSCSKNQSSIVFPSTYSKNKGATLAYSIIDIKDLVKAWTNKLLDPGSNMRWIMDLTILVVPIVIKTEILDVGDI